MAKELCEDGEMNIGSNVSPDNANASLSQGAAYDLSAQDKNANNTNQSTKNLEATNNNQPGEKEKATKPAGYDALRKGLSTDINSIFSSLKGSSIEDDVKEKLNSLIKTINGALEKKNQSGIQFIK